MRPCSAPSDTLPCPAQVEVIANDQGNRTTPSYVAFTPTERLSACPSNCWPCPAHRVTVTLTLCPALPHLTVGDAAKNQVAMNPQNTVFDAKRLIGRKFNDPTVQVSI